MSPQQNLTMLPAMPKARPWIAARLDELAANGQGASRAGLARALGLAPARISEMIAGDRGLSAAEAATLADYLSLPIETVVLAESGRDLGALPQQMPTGMPKRSFILPIGKVEYAAIAQFDMALSAGPGSMLSADPEPLGYQLVEMQWLRALTRAAPERLAVVRVAGDSMEPTLNDGDWILVDLTQKRVTREGIYALHVYEDAWVKRMSVNLRERMVRIISDNDRYPMQEMPEDEVDLIGRAISVVARKI